MGDYEEGSFFFWGGGGMHGNLHVDALRNRVGRFAE